MPPGPRYNPVHDDTPSADIELADLEPITTGVVLSNDEDRPPSSQPSALTLCTGDDDLRVLDSKGRTFKFNVDLSTLTLLLLKAIVAEKSGVPEPQQRLIYSGRELSNEAETLASSGVKAGTVVHLFQRPSGAAPLATASEIRSPTATATAPAVVDAQGVDAVAVVVPGDLGRRGQLLSTNQELEASRRHVKFLASLLLLISVLNLVTLMIYFGDALLGEHMSGAQWGSLMFEIMVNCAGVSVGGAGVRGSASLDYDTVWRYTIGLLLVGALYISANAFTLLRATLHEPIDDGVAPNPATPTGGHALPGSSSSSSSSGNGDDDGSSSGGGSSGGGSSGGNTDDDEQGGGGGDMSAAAVSLLITVMIWSMCFQRAFEFRRLLHSALHPTAGADHATAASAQPGLGQGGAQRQGRRGRVDRAGAGSHNRHVAVDAAAGVV